MRWSASLITLLTAVATTRAAGPTTAPATRPAGPTVVRLTLHPVAVADPPLKYELLPPLAEQHVGDAAYEYEFASHTLRLYERDPSRDIGDRIYDLLDAPPEKFSQADADALLKEVWAPNIDSAARCQGAHWAADFRERGIDTLLPHLNYMRMMAQVMALRTRLALVRGDLPEAVRAMQTNFAMARQMRDQPFLVQSLVAVGIARLTMERCVEPWLSRPDAPNLYWALSAMPPSFTDPYGVAEVERSSLRFTDRPWVALAMDDQLPPDQWPRVVGTLARLRHYGSSYDPTKAFDVAAARRKLVADLSSRARDHLSADGRPAAAVAAMSDDEAVGRYLLWQSDAVYDQMWKAWTLPFPEAVGPLRRAAAAFREAGAAGNTLVDIKSPAGARYALARADERLAALRVIEALRDHAARHGGRPPASLGEIAELPVPPDPVTGQPFVYRADGATAVLELPAPPEVNPTNACRYELTFVTP
jgi:hypothetical protein